MEEKNSKKTKKIIWIVVGFIIIIAIFVGIMWGFNNKNQSSKTEEKNILNNTLEGNLNDVSSEFNIASETNTVEDTNETLIENITEENNTIAEENAIDNSLNSNKNNTKTKSKENIVLYCGVDISKDNLMYSIPYNKKNKTKYEIKYYNYENGKYKGETKGKLEQTYEGVGSVSNTSKIAMSQKYNAIPRKYKSYTDGTKIPKQLEEFFDCQIFEVQSIDLDGDNKDEYIIAYGNGGFSGEENKGKYSNFSEIILLNSNFDKVATLVRAKDQFQQEGDTITNDYYCDLNNVEYIDIDNDNVMEILVDTNVYEGIGVNVYKYQNGKISGNTDFDLEVMP